MPETVEEVKRIITNAFREQTAAPLEFVENFNQYSFLFHGEVSKIF